MYSPAPVHMTSPSESWISGRQSTGPGLLVSEYQYMEVMGAMPSCADVTAQKQLRLRRP